MKWLKLQQTLVSLEAGLLLFITLTGCAENKPALKNDTPTKRISQAQHKNHLSSKKQFSNQSQHTLRANKQAITTAKGDAINPLELKQNVCDLLTENGYRATVDFQLVKQESTELERLRKSGVVGDFQFYTVVIFASLPPERRCIAVASDGKAYILPRAINSIVTEAFKKDFSEEKAVQIAELYAITSSTAPDTCKLLYSAKDIPASKDKPIDSDQVAMVKTPQVHQTAQGYTVTVFFWYNVGGDIKQFKFLINKQGNVIDKEEKTVAKRIGNYDVRQ